MIKVNSNAEVVLEQLQGMEARIKDVRPVLEDFGEHMVNSSIPENFRAGGRPDRWASGKWQSGSGPNRDTGRLLRSIRFEVRRGSVRMGSNYKTAAIRNDGGTIQAKPGKALLIPLPGTPRSMRRPSAWRGRLFRVPGKNPDTVGVLVTADRAGNLTPRFVLRRKVTQKARPFLLLQDSDELYLRDAITAHAEGPQTLGDA